MIELPESAKLSIKQNPFQIFTKQHYPFVLNELANQDKSDKKQVFISVKYIKKQNIQQYFEETDFNKTESFHDFIPNKEISNKNSCHWQLF